MRKGMNLSEWYLQIKYCKPCYLFLFKVAILHSLTWKNVHKHWKGNKPKVTKGLIKLINALIKKTKHVDVDNSVRTAYCLQHFYKLKSQNSMQSSMHCLLFTTFVVYKLKLQASMGIVQVIWLLHNVFTVCLTIYHRCLDTTHVKMFQKQKYI